MEERGLSRGGGRHECNIFYLGPEAVGAHSERGWFWLVCASPEGRAIEIPEERLILYYMRICDVVAEGLRNGVRARCGTHSKSVIGSPLTKSADEEEEDLGQGNEEGGIMC